MSTHGTAPAAASAPSNWVAWPRARLSPAVLLAVILSIFGVVWLTHLAYTSSPPPTDNIQQLTWVGSQERGYYAQRDGAKPTPQDTPASNTSRDKSSRALLLIWGIVPLLFMPLVGLISGADLQLQWGTPFLLFAVPAAMELSSPWVAWSGRGLKPALKAFVVIQSMLLLLSHLTSPRGPLALQGNHWRTFDGAALASAVAPNAREALGGRICVVSGPGALAGAMAPALPERPSVLIDGRYDRSPWVDKRVVEMCGAVELSDGVLLPGGKEVGSAFPGLSSRIQLPAPAWDASITAMNRVR